MPPHLGRGRGAHAMRAEGLRQCRVRPRPGLRPPTLPQRGDRLWNHQRDVEDADSSRGVSPSPREQVDRPRRAQHRGALRGPLGPAASSAHAPAQGSGGVGATAGRAVGAPRSPQPEYVKMRPPGAAGTPAGVYETGDWTQTRTGTRLGAEPSQAKPPPEAGVTPETPHPRASGGPALPTPGLGLRPQELGDSALLSFRVPQVAVLCSSGHGEP